MELAWRKADCRPYTMNPIAEFSIEMLDNVCLKSGWHGPSLVPTLRKLSLDDLVYAGTYEGYTAWGVALHCAYWKYRVRKRLLQLVPEEPAAPRFARGPADWPALPQETSEANWRIDFNLLLAEHAALKDVIVRLPAATFVPPAGRARDGASRLIHGIAAHDAYHTAQIRNMGLPNLRRP